MRPEDIDDLFRSSLDDHSSTPPPADALWARLQQTAPEPTAAPAAQPSNLPAAEQRLDALFQSMLNSHRSPVSRELWERLEDEHLRPRKRRVAAWWPMAVAAVVALLLVAGGAGLLLNGNFQQGQTGQLATTSPAKAGRVQSTDKTSPTQTSPFNISTEIESIAKNTATQATRLTPASSSAPEASQLAAEAATTGGIARSASQDRRASKANAMLAQQRPGSSKPKAPEVTAPQPVQLMPEPAPQVAVAPSSSNTPDLASPAGVIEVEVRKGSPVPTVESLTEVAAVETPSSRRGLGRLIGRASEAVRDAKQDLLARAAQVENVTVHARIGERTISKTIIQL